MANPWDSMPLPTDADLDDKLTFESIGRITDMWERIEFTLSRVHSVFCGDPDGSEAMREYGAGRVVPERNRIIRAAFDRWTHKHHNQKLEGEFDKLMVEYVGFSDRRNEIAHGLVHPVSGLIFFQLSTTLPAYKVQYAVIPAYHAVKHYHDNGVPKFMYNTPMMQTLYVKLADLYVRIGDFLHEIEPPLPPLGQ